MTDATDPTDATSGLPPWVKALTTVGFPIALAAFLLAQSAGWIPSETSALRQAVAGQTTREEQHHQTSEALGTAVKTALRVLCENAANTEPQRRNCEIIR
jgi:hypothetical protein